MVQGAVLVEGPPDEIMHNEQVRAVYLARNTPRSQPWLSER